MSLKHEVFQERLEEARRTYKLNLGYCNLVELPQSFMPMVRMYNPNITELDLTSNKLTSLPKELAELKYLRVVRVKYNRLPAIPEVVYQLQQCTTLDLAGNQIEAVPDDIAAMQQLRELDLSGNRIQQLTDRLDEVPLLHTIYLENNLLEQLPERIGNCASLLKLNCSTNMLRSLPASMGDLRKIQRLDFANNMISRVPPRMGHLKNLKELNLRYNNLEGPYQAASDEGLSKFLLFLKKEEEREEQEERERLRPIGTQVGGFMEYRCKAQAAQLIKTGDGGVEIDNRPWSRDGATICRHHDRLYVFGGRVVKDDKKTNEVYWMTVDRMEWHKQECKGENAPCARDGHVAVINPESNTMVVFGGRSQEKRRLNDVYTLDLDTFTWSRQNTGGAPPAPRDWASAVFWQGSMVVFGGHAIGSRQNDLMRLDLSTWKWAAWASATSAPSPRESSAFCVGHGSLLFLHGGCNNFGLEDLWVFDCRQNYWIQVQTEGRRPPVRRNHHLVVYKDHLYLFGGYDDLGAPTTTMFRVHVPYGINLATEKPVWEQLVMDLAFNKNRMSLFFESEQPPEGQTQCSGHLCCLQLGSKLMGIGNDEDNEKGNAFWDIYKVTDLDALQVKEVDPEMLKPKNAKSVRIQHTINQHSKMPKSFTEHSAKEVQLLRYLEDFQATFTELYRHRRPLFLTPKNECGVPKFVSTTVRPTKMMYSELYDMAGAIQFVTNFISYEPLENLLHMPEYLPSPMSTLSFQAGDSFDMATLLVSLLCGTGHDAYVIVGYAPLDVVMNDQTKSTCPLLEEEERKQAEAAQAAQQQDSGKGIKMKSELTLESAYLKGIERAKQEVVAKAAAEAEAARVAAIAADRAQMLANADRAVTRDHRLVHAWVLVRAGERDVKADTFVECTSGRTYPTDYSPYLGVEFAWNHQNFWVNMQHPEPHSDSRSHPAKMEFNFRDADRWEAVLSMAADVAPAAKSDRRPQGGGSEEDAALEHGELRRSPSSKLSAIREEGRKLHLESANSVDRPDTAGSGTSRPAVGSADAPRAAFDIELPGPWVPKLFVARDMIDMRCPKGNKKTVYRFSEHEVFAFFGECSRDWDGMVERLTIFADEEHKVILEYREYFMRRKDKLRERRAYYDGERIARTVEYFDPGSAYGVKVLNLMWADDASGVWDQQRRVSEFYSSARLDGMAHKDEHIGVKTVELYEGRTDRMWYQSVTYGKPKVAVDAAERKKSAERVLPVVKMTQKFLRSENTAAAEEVAKRTFYLMQDSIRIDYHVMPDHLTASYRVYCKDGRSEVVQVNPLANKLDHILQLEQFQELLACEKDCLTAVRESEFETRAFAKIRNAQEMEKQLVTPYYDIMRVKADESDDDEEEVSEVVYDYLSPFLPKITGARALTRAEALTVRESCLRALKDRLIERANIIQARHDEESAALAKRQTNFQRDRDQLAKEAEREYEQACEESMFRISILEKRLKRHEEQALRKYYELDHKLRKDSRLAVLLDPSAV